MPEISGSNRGSGINFLDITLVILILMTWFFLNMVWTNSLANIMFGVSVLIVSVYLTSRFTGFLSFMKLSVPTWTISFLFALPIMWLFIKIIPVINPTSSISQDITETAITSFFGADNIVRFLQIYMFPITESLLIVFLLAFFVGVALNQYKGNISSQNRTKALIPLMVVSLFGSLIHTTIAKKLAEIGSVKFGVSLLQQWGSFILFGLFGIFLAPGIITSHIAKNLFVFGNFNWFIITLFIFIGLDTTILILFGGKAQLNIRSYFT